MKAEFWGWAYPTQDSFWMKRENELGARVIVLLIDSNNNACLASEGLSPTCDLMPGISCCSPPKPTRSDF